MARSTDRDRKMLGVNGEIARDWDKRLPKGCFWGNFQKTWEYERVVRDNGSLSN